MPCSWYPPTHSPRAASGPAQAAEASIDPSLRKFWATLPEAKQRNLMTVSKKAFFEKIRSLYCSRCYGLFVMR